MMKHGYTGKFEIIDDHRAAEIIVSLMGRLNKCEVISPDLMCNSKSRKMANNLLLSCQFGFIVLTTSAGIMMDHEEAR